MNLMLLNPYVLLTLIALFAGDFWWGYHTADQRCAGKMATQRLALIEASDARVEKDAKAAHEESTVLKAEQPKRDAAKEAALHEVKAHIPDNSDCAVGLDVLRALDNAGGDSVQPGP